MKSQLVVTYYLESSEQLSESLKRGLAFPFTILREMAGGRAGLVDISYPLDVFNLQRDGLTFFILYLLNKCKLNTIRTVKLLNISNLDLLAADFFKGPFYGLRTHTQGQINVNQTIRGLTLPIRDNSLELLEDVKEALNQGFNFLKENDLQPDLEECSLKERVELIADFDRKNPTPFTYCANITADPVAMYQKISTVVDSGMCGLSLNPLYGLGFFRTVRELRGYVKIHYQSSSSSLFNSEHSNCSIAEGVLLGLAGLSGCDFLSINPKNPNLKGVVSLLNSLDCVPVIETTQPEELQEILGHSNWIAMQG